MKREPIQRGLLAAIVVLLAGCAGVGAQSGSAAAAGGMSFFVTSVGLGKGADLGGLTGADKHCQALATAAGAGGKTWRAYLSTGSAGGATAVHARDRIGKGPWRNAKGQTVAGSLDQLHGAGNNVTKLTALNEKGDTVNGRGDTPNRHDMLTGSRIDGTAFAPDPDMTCGNWTRGSTEGAVMVGHHDRAGPTQDPWALSWNSSHSSRGGCSQEALRGTGGDGLFYCFAAD